MGQWKQLLPSIPMFGNATSVEKRPFTFAPPPEAKSNNYIKHRTESLLKTETINTMITEERRKKLDAEGVTDNWLIERYKTIADLAESDNAKLRSLDSLAKISGLFDTEEKKSEQVTIWAGFSPEQLEEVEKHGKPEIIAHAEKDKND